MKLQKKTFILIIIALSLLLFGCGKLSEGSDQKKGQYIINSRSGKIHSETCQYVRQMNEKNKLVVEDSLLNLLKKEYTVCRKCRAGVKKNNAAELFDRLWYPNLYVEDIEENAAYADYLQAVDSMGKWYVDHIPTYAGTIQQEPFSMYSGNLSRYKEYELNNRGSIQTYLVMTDDENSNSIESVDAARQILRANEKAAENYLSSYKDIIFKKQIAYYPCNILSNASDYNTPGDDCVRLLFAILNTMDSQFTKKYQRLSGSSYSKTNSTSLASNKSSIIFAMINLGFQVFGPEQGVVDVNEDDVPEGYIFGLEDDFSLKKGDILARKGHVHIYLGDGLTEDADNFGWGRVYRSYPQNYTIKVDKTVDGKTCIALTNGKGETEFYTRVLRYIGN